MIGSLREAAETMIGSLRQRHLLPMVTSAAILSGVGRIDSGERSASFFRFAGELSKELRPRRVTDAFCQTMVMDHPIDGQVFNTDHAEAVNDLPALLVSEVLTSKCDAFMDPRYRLTVLASLLSALCQLGVFALYFGQRLLFPAKEARVLNLGSIGEGSKGLESNVNPDLFGTLRKALGFALNRETHIPLPRRRSLNRTGFDGPFDLAVVDHLHPPNFREAHPILMGETKTRLRVGETIIAMFPTETGIAWVLSSLAPSEKGFEGQIDANRNILQDLGMHAFEGGTLVFQEGEGLLLLIKRETLSRLFIGAFASFQQVIIEPTTLMQGLVERFDLFLGWVYSVLVSFTHAHSIAQNRVVCQAKPLYTCPKQGTPIHPRFENTGLSGPLTVN